MTEQTVNTVGTKEKTKLKEQISQVYNLHGQATAIDWVVQWNKNHVRPIPFEDCKGCESSSPAIDHECCLCGQATEPQTAPKFYQAVLKPVKNVIKHVYPTKAHLITLEERLPNNCRCENCGKNEWILLPKESIAVRESGKQYIECMGCGETTHL